MSSSRAKGLTLVCHIYCNLIIIFTTKKKLSDILDSQVFFLQVITAINKRCMYTCIYYSSPRLSHSELPNYSHASPWPIIGHLFISMANQTLISYITVVLICIRCSMTYFFSLSLHLAWNTDNVQLCLWSQCIPHRKHANSATMALQVLYTGRYMTILWANFDYI